MLSQPTEGAQISVTAASRISYGFLTSALLAAAEGVLVQA